MSSPTPNPSQSQVSQVRVGLLVAAAVLAITGILMIIIPLAGSASLRGILVLLFLLTGSALISFAVWLARNPSVDLLTDPLVIFQRKKQRKRASSASEETIEVRNED